MTKTVNFDTLRPLFDGTKLWWKNIGVMPREDDEITFTTYDAFTYTNGLSEDCEVWCSMLSVEGRFSQPEFISAMVNAIGLGLMHGTVEPGDSVIVWDEEEGGEVNSVFWIGELEPNDGRRETNFTNAEMIVPVRWSSCFGPKSEEEEHHDQDT